MNTFQRDTRPDDRQSIAAGSRAAHSEETGSAPAGANPLATAKRLVRRTMAVLFWALVLLAVVNYGGVEAEGRSVLTLGIYLVLLVSLFVAGLPSHTRPALVTAACLLLAVMAVVFLQTASLSLPIPAHPAWTTAAPFLMEPVAPTASLTPADDRFALLTVALPFGFFMAGLVLFDTDERALKALKIVAWSGGFIALWSIAQFQLLPDTLIFDEKRHYLDSLTGFFVNRNTAATFFGLVGLALYALLMRTAEAVEWRRMVALFESRSPLPRHQVRRVWRVFGIAFLLALAFTALMLTRSRAGLAATFIGFALFGMLSFAFSGGPKQQGFGGSAAGRTRRRLAGLVLFLAILVAGFAIFGGKALLRAEIGGLNDARFCIAPGIMAAIRDQWPWGGGLASFATLYPPYHNPACGVTFVFLRAHNVYAEGLLTLGVAFPLLAAVFIVGLVAIFIRGIRKRRGMRFAGSLGLSALALVAFHSAFDFSIQIPGLAIVLAVILAPAVTLCLNPPGRVKGGRRRRSRSVPADAGWQAVSGENARDLLAER